MEADVRAVRPADIDLLAANLRQADRLEITALSTLPVREIIAASVRASTHVWAAWLGEELGALFGVAPASLLGGRGVPWLLSTAAVERHPRTFIRANRRYLGLMREAYPYLANYVDARYERSIRWLRWLGFELHAPQPIGRNGELFHLFELRT